LFNGPLTASQPRASLQRFVMLGTEVAMTEGKQAIIVEHEDDERGGAFFIAREDVRLAEMTYTRSSADAIVVDHTEVHERLRGLGVARKLLDALVAWARETHTLVRATCPYALAQFEQDASIRDVLA
jgi:uncharacterized protein